MKNLLITLALAMILIAFFAYIILQVLGTCCIH